MLLVLEFFGEDGGPFFEVLYFFVDGGLNCGINFSLFGLDRDSFTIYFLRMEMLLASSSSKDFSFFQMDSDCIFRITINRISKLDAISKISVD